jgi:ABC-type transport system involved in multi-copper enzyme maturation permease subunit
VIPLLVRSASQARYVLVGAFVLLCGFQIIIVGQAAEIERSNAFGRMAELLPGFLQRGLGSRAMLLASFKGTVAFGYFHPVVCMIVSVVAMYLAVELAHEVESGLIDLELSRPVARHRLVTRSVLLMLGASGVAVLLMAAGTSLGMRFFGAGDLDLPPAQVRAWMLLNLFAIASCFGGFALLVASWSARWTTALTLAVLMSVVLYCLDFLAIGWPPMRNIAWLSPFHYYPALDVLAGDAPMGRNLGILFASAAAMTATAYWQFHRRDL